MGSAREHVPRPSLACYGDKRSSASCHAHSARTATDRHSDHRSAKSEAGIGLWRMPWTVATTQPAEARSGRSVGMPLALRPSQTRCSDKERLLIAEDQSVSRCMAWLTDCASLAVRCGSWGRCAHTRPRDVRCTRGVPSARIRARSGCRTSRQLVCAPSSVNRRARVLDEHTHPRDRSISSAALRFGDAGFHAHRCSTVSCDPLRKGLRCKNRHT